MFVYTESSFVYAIQPVRVALLISIHIRQRVCAAQMSLRYWSVYGNVTQHEVIC